jgi:hypothetical protein
MGDCTIDRWVDVGRTMKTQNVFMEQCTGGVTPPVEEA